MKKLLICGDSFAMDYSKKYPDANGWPNQIAKHFKVTNLAENGVSEYKVWQQLKSAKLNKFDCVIVSHASPNRIFVREHPVHRKDPFRKNTDFLYADVKEHVADQPVLQPVLDFFENYFDLDYANDMHNLICKEIDQLLKASELPEENILHIIYRDQDHYKFKNSFCFFDTFLKHRGLINHYDDEGNAIIYKRVFEYFQNQI